MHQGSVHTLTEATGDDATTALDLLTAVEGYFVRVTADAAYDTVAVYETATAWGATVIIPPAKTAIISGHGPRSPALDRTITVVKTLGRRRWKQVSGYHRQGRVENTFFRYKGTVKLTKSWSIYPQDTGLEPVVNPPYWASENGHQPQLDNTSVIAGRLAPHRPTLPLVAST